MCKSLIWQRREQRIQESDVPCLNDCQLSSRFPLLESGENSGIFVSKCFPPPPPPVPPHTMFHCWLILTGLALWVEILPKGRKEKTLHGLWSYRTGSQRPSEKIPHNLKQYKRNLPVSGEDTAISLTACQDKPHFSDETSHPPHAVRLVQIPTFIVCAGSHTNLADRRSHRAGTFSTSEQRRRGSSTCAVNLSATTCVHWRCIISTQNMFHLIKKDIYMHIYMHACHFGNFPGDNSDFHICKRVCWEVWGRNGWHITFTNHFQKEFTQQVSNTLNSGKSDCKLQEKENVWTSVYFIFITLPLKVSVYTTLILFKPQKSMGFHFFIP